MSKTYTFSDVEMKINEKREPQTLSHILDKMDKPYLLCSSDMGECLSSTFSHGLLGTIYNAYSDHTPLTLRPDDVWLSICVAFGKFIVRNAEKMRDYFVSHQGQEDLTINNGAGALIVAHPENPNSWDAFISETINRMNGNCNAELMEWFQPAFTTTTEKDKLISKMVLMGATKEYFRYGGELGCGLSQITLEGTKEDWQSMINKLDFLVKFHSGELSEWASLLEHVLTHFVDFFDDKVNEDFWQRIVTSERRGSGGQEKFRGWFLVFSPFSEDGKYILYSKEDVLRHHVYGVINDSELDDCIIDFPVKTKNHITGEEKKLIIYTGMWASEYKENSLRPLSGYLVIEKAHISEKMFVEYAMKKAEKMPEKYAKFVYHFAELSGVPQDYTYKLHHTFKNYAYYKSDPQYKENPTMEEMSEFLKKTLLSKYRYYSIGTDLSKYFKMDDINSNFIKAYNKM